MLGPDALLEYIRAVRKTQCCTINCKIRRTDDVFMIDINMITKAHALIGAGVGSWPMDIVGRETCGIYRIMVGYGL